MDNWHSNRDRGLTLTQTKILYPPFFKFTTYVFVSSTIGLFIFAWLFGGLYFGICSGIFWCGSNVLVIYVVGNFLDFSFSWSSKDWLAKGERLWREFEGIGGRFSFLPDFI